MIELALNALSALSTLPEVALCLKEQATCKSDGSMYEDIHQDSMYFQDKLFLEQHPDALLFRLYADDFEIVNPIGSHCKKHKLTAF